MKKGQIYEGVVERVEFPNKGIIRCEEETAVVKKCDTRTEGLFFGQ